MFFFRYLKDFFTSMIDLGWRWIFLYFAASFFVSWLFFAVIWYLIMLVHGDFIPEEDR
jgi:potassium inwardly-rectifying channel subfamily J